jgi:hypothetical protein
MTERKRLTDRYVSDALKKRDERYEVFDTCEFRPAVARRGSY